MWIHFDVFLLDSSLVQIRRDIAKQNGDSIHEILDGAVG